MSTPQDLVWAEQVVDRSAVAPFIERHVLFPLRRQLPIRTLLLGILLTAMDHRELTLTRATGALRALPTIEARRLGVIGDTIHGETGHLVTYRQVEDTFRVVMGVLDYRPVPAFHGVPDETKRWHAFKARQPSQTEVMRRKSALEFVCDRLLEATVPRRFRRHGAHALDWTDAPAWAKGKKSSWCSADPTAGWRSKTTKASPTRPPSFFGFHEQTLVITREEGGGKVPELVRRVELYAANEEPEQRSLQLLDRATRDGVTAGDLLADSAYSYTKGWTIAAWSLGYTPIVDLHPNDRAARGEFAGAKVIGDGIFCPAMPADLQTIDPPSRRPSSQELAVYDTRIAKRNQYRFQAHGARQRNGCHRFSCPAERGLVRCPLVKKSMSLPAKVPEILHPPAHPPACCTQRTITIPPEVGGKARQKHEWMSPSWRRSYGRRSAVERGYGDVKSPTKGGLVRGAICMMGVAKIQFMRIFAYMARNLGILIACDTPTPSSTPTSLSGMRPRQPRQRTYADARARVRQRPPPG